MRRSGITFTRAVLSAGVLAGMIAWSCAWAGSAAAQDGQWRKSFQQRRAAAAARQAEKPVMRPNAGGGANKPNLRAMDGLPPKWVENMRNMTPDEQERFMQNDARFSNLPPQRQQQIRNNLQKWNSLTPPQQQALRQREAVLEQMSPEQRQYFTNVVGPKWQAMPQERRQVVNRHLAMLQQMSPATQQAALSDPKFTQGMNPDEQQMLKDLNSLRNPPAE